MTVCRFLYLLCASCSAFAQGPSFECANATAPVERLICTDVQLSALDRKLASAYGDALKKQGTPAPAWLMSAQRSWTLERNDCVKSSDVRSCVLSAYTNRIATIQAKSGLVGAIGPVTYHCANDTGGELIATFYRTDPPSVILQRGDKSILVFEALSASGAKYEGANAMLWDKGGEAQVTWFGHKLQCSARR